MFGVDSGESLKKKRSV